MCSIGLTSKLWFPVSSFLWMGNSMPLNGSVSAGIDCKSCLCGPREESCIKHEKYTFDFEKSMKTNPLEDLEISSSTEEEQELEHWIVQVLGASLSEVLHVHDNLGPLCVSDQDENYNNQGTQPLLLDTGMLDDPNMHETVLCSGVVQPYPLTLDAVEDLSCGMVDKGKFSMEAPASAYPLPVKKLISAFKGSREKQGERLSTKLSVRWAPEVYDPPITSSSHTMKGHHRHHHHKTKKDYNVHKCTKGKSSRGSERKHAHRRSSDSSSLMDPWILKSRNLSLPSKEAVRNEKQGERLSTKLSVKWAPEVYDLPITSSSHKMKGHHRHHHHKTKKDCNLTSIQRASLHVGERGSMHIVEAAATAAA